MILRISLRAKAGVPKTLVKRKFRLHSLYVPQHSLTLTESNVEFSDLHSILDFTRFAIGETCFKMSNRLRLKSRDETNNTSSEIKERSKNMK